MKELHPCERCGAVMPPEQLHHFDGRDLCIACLEERSLVCSNCGDRLWADDNAGSTELPLCQSGYDDHYTNCCGKLSPAMMTRTSTVSGPPERRQSGRLFCLHQARRLPQ